VKHLAFVLAVAALVLPLRAANPFGDASDAEDSRLKQVQALKAKCDAVQSQPQTWRAAWLDGDTNESALSRLAVDLATSPALRRSELKQYLNNRAAKDGSYKAVLKNLDVGRHQLLKMLFSRALDEANKRLVAKKLTPLDRTCVLNSGGTGNFARDIDVTVFAGDDVRETAFFEALGDVSKSMGLNVTTGPGGTVKNGIELADLEVAFHRGGNDLPDARFATDPVEFQLNYQRVIDAQARNPEAYFGYGSDTEVVGRRYLSFKAGQTLVQTFEATSQGVRYTGQVASCMREARAILRGSSDQRIRKAQRAVHAGNDYLQAWRHEQQPGSSPTQGALKYAGRALDELCAFHGFRPWSELVLEDRIQLLARMYGPHYLEQAGNRQRLQKMAEALDTASLVLVGKDLPKALTAETPEAAQKLQFHEHAALAFLRDAANSMAASVAEEMLEPPMLARSFLAQVNKDDNHWQEMSPEERDAYARHEDAIYQRCLSAAAMENLLVLISQLKVIDQADGKTNGDSAIRKIIDGANPNVRPLLEAAAKHAEASAVLLNANASPETRAQAEKTMAAAREELSALLKKPAPGDEILGIAKGMSPREFIRMQNLNQPPCWSAALEEMKVRMRKHIEDSFPENTYESVNRQLAEFGKTGYIAKRVYEEAFQLGNVVDALSLVEMYQRSAGREDYAKFVTQNLLGRCYWGLGFLAQAAEVKDEESLKALGQNLVFDAFGRVIPGLAHAKVLFDIERGLVTVTVGWALDEANTALIDALYTGEAGRLTAGAEGTVGGRIRDSGFCVLDAKYIRLVTEPKTGRNSIQIDQPALYKAYYQRWIQGPSGRDLPFDELNGRPPIPGQPGKLLAAHDRLARAVLDIGADVDPSWFSPRQTLQDKSQLDKAMAEFVQLISPFCREETDRVIGESAVREYIQNGRDVIADSLHRRLLSDVLSGMLAVWQTQRMEHQYAKRQVQYMAGLGDMHAMAEALAQPLPEGAFPKCDLEVDATLPAGETTAYTRYGKLPLTCRLRADAPIPASAGEIGINLEPQEFRCTNAAEFGKTTLNQVGVQKIRLVARTKQGTGDIVAEKVVEVPLTIVPTPFSIARYADTVNLMVNGRGVVRSVSNGDTREEEGSQSVNVSIPSSDYRTPKAATFRLAWSGDGFSGAYSEEIAQPDKDNPSRGPVSINIAVAGTMSAAQRSVSYRGQQTLVEKQISPEGKIRRVVTTVQDVEAENISVSGFTSCAGFFDTGTEAAPGQPPGPKPHVSGKSNVHEVYYDDEGKMASESTKTVEITDPNGGGSASFMVSSADPGGPPEIPTQY